MMLQRKIALSACVAMLYASTASGMDLLESWHAAQSADPQFAAARAGAEAGKKKTDQAKALQLPQVVASVGAGGVSNYNKISGAEFSAPGMGSASGADFTTRTRAGLDLRWNVTAEQPLYNAERTATSNQLQKQAELADVKLNAEQQLLILRVAKAYFDVLLAQDTLNALQSQQKATARALEIAKGRYAEGDAAIIDTREAQARHDALGSQELEAQSQLQLAHAALADLTGAEQQALAKLPKQMDLQSLNAGELNDWLNQAKESSLSLNMQKIRQEIAKVEIDKHHASSAPVLNLVAQAGGEELNRIGSSRNAELSNYNLGVGVQLTIPLFTGGMRNAKYEEAMALADQANSEVEVVRQQAGQEARAAWLGVSVGKGRVKALEQALVSAQTKLDATKLGREVGDRTTLDVLNAEQDVYATQTGLSRARYQVLLSYLSLAATAGNLDEQRLNEINILLTEKAQ